MIAHGLLLPGGHSSAAVLSRSRSADQLLQNSLRICNLSYVCGERTLNYQLGYSLASRSRNKRSVCMYGTGWQRDGGSEGRRQTREDRVIPEIVEESEEIRVPRRTVAVFWDLDNKPPNHVPPYDAALRLKKLAGEFGEVVDMVAYANQNAFNYIPARVREERQDRRMLDQLEKSGVVKVEQPYICSMCGRKSKTNLDLKRHFKRLHEKERNKRLAYLGQLKGKKRTKFLEKVAPKESKYKEAARTVLVPKVGYGLAAELKRAGVAVRTVDKRPQAADEALLRHMNLYIHKGIQCICLVSDDSDFLEILKFAKSKHIFTVVVGDAGTFKATADSTFSWEHVASGRSMLAANESFQRWANEDALRAELDDDEFGDVSDDDASFPASDEEEFLEFQRNLRSSMKLSPFADDEDAYPSDEEEQRTDEDSDSEVFGGWDREVEEASSSERFL